MGGQSQMSIIELNLKNDECFWNRGAPFAFSGC